MILADTSIWVSHLREGEPRLSSLLEGGQVMVHPFIIGELALGNLQSRSQILEYMSALPEIATVEQEELLRFIDKHKLHGQGIGLVDAHLLASACLEAVPLWTHDKRLHGAAVKMGVTA